MTGFLLSCNNDANGDDAGDTTEMADTATQVIDPNEVIPDSARIVNDSLIVPDASVSNTDSAQ